LQTENKNHQQYPKPLHGNNIIQQQLQKRNNTEGSPVRAYPSPGYLFEFAIPAIGKEP